MSLTPGSDIGGPHHQREEILPCRGGDFDYTAEHVVFRSAPALCARLS
jgi:hypothetical protein